MNKMLRIIVILILALVITGGGYAYSYLTATTSLNVTVAGNDIATAPQSANQPNWGSILTPLTGSIETLRPNAAGDQTNIGYQFPVSGQHWDKVGEATSDNDSTYIESNSATWQEDLYNITDHSTGSTNINYVKVYVVVKAMGTPTQTSAYVHIKTNGVTFNGSAVTTTTTYATYTYQWNANPQTGASWTWSEVDALQIGIGLRQPRTTGAGAERYTRCTQIYAEVNWGTQGIPLCGNVPTGNLFDVTPNGNYTGDLAVKVYLTNTGALVKAYQYLNMKLYLQDSVEAGQTPNYQLLTLDNGEATFNLENYSPGTKVLSVTGGSYCLVSTDTTKWKAGWSVTPEFYCQILQR